MLEDEIFEVREFTEEEILFRNDMVSHREPICPECKKGRIVCPQGKIPKPHYFECTNECGWYADIYYNDVVVE